MLITTVFLSLLCVPTHVTAIVPASNLHGQVTNAVTLQGIGGATITVKYGSAIVETTTTDGSGHYTMSLEASFDGTLYEVTAEKSDYTPQTVNVVVYAGDNDPGDKELNFNLQPPPADVETWTNVQTDIFSVDDPEYPVYVMGYNYAPSTTYQVYVVLDTTWTNGMTIPARVTGSRTSITSSPWGTLGIPSPQQIWNVPLIPGAYDIIVDVNGNGVYDEGVDALDDNDVGTAGFIVTPSFVIPETPWGVASLTLAMLAAAALTQRRGLTVKF